MTHNDLVKKFEKISLNMFETMKKKNADYAGNDDAFSNFRLVEVLKISTTEQGILVRMCDKFSRISNLLSGKNPEVKNESIQDTLQDLAVYSILLSIIVSETSKREN